MNEQEQDNLDDARGVFIGVYNGILLSFVCVYIVLLLATWWS